MKIAQTIHDALTRSGGRTLGGKPNYKFAYSPDFTYLISNGKRYEPFRVVAEDCWLLLKFEPAEWWGTPEEWEMNNYESSAPDKIVNGVAVLGAPLLTAGPYPYNGRYRNIMRIKRPIVLDGETFLREIAPDFQWLDEVFPSVRDFLDLPTEKKRDVILARDKEYREHLSRKFQASRANYRGVATSKQVKDKEEAIERWLKNPENVELVQSMSTVKAN